MKLAHYSPQARADLEDIWFTIACDDIETADLYLDQLRERCERLADFPLMGRPCPELGIPDLMVFPLDRYLVFYRVHDNGIEIARFWHGAREISNILIE